MGAVPSPGAKEGTSWMEQCGRDGEHGVPSSLAPTKPHCWLCPGVRLPGGQLSQVEGGVGDCLWALGVSPVDTGWWRSVEGLGALSVMLQKESGFQPESQQTYRRGGILQRWPVWAETEQSR